jgi:hypothetical protein
MTIEFLNNVELFADLNDNCADLKELGTDVGCGKVDGVHDLRC